LASPFAACRAGHEEAPVMQLVLDALKQAAAAKSVAVAAA
jgi:hypothetical protein